MAEYIKRENVLEFSRIFDDQLWETGGYRIYPTEAVPVNAIRNIPSADVAEVVRCKDCRHRDPEDHKCDCGQLERAGCVFPVDDDYFCAYGERRGGT